MTRLRSICFAQNCISIRTDDERSAKLVDSLFHDVYSPDFHEGHTTIRLSYRESTGFYHCFRNDEPVYIGHSEGNLLRQVMDRAVFALADKAEGGLLFHAAALRSGEKMLLLPGESGSGKSSLAGWLACCGFGYLTDEMVFMPFNAPRIDTFARPLNIKTRGLSVLASFFDADQCAGHLVRGGGATLVPHRLLNPRFDPGRRLSLALIVFPRYKDGSETSLQELSAAGAGLRLMEVLVNARNLSGHGFRETTRLASTTPAYSLAYSDFSDIADRIRSLLLEGASGVSDRVRTSSVSLTRS